MTAPLLDPVRHREGGLAPDLTRLPAAELAVLLQNGQVSAVEVVQAHLQRIAVVEPHIRALLHIDGEAAVAAARRVDRDRAEGVPLGPLAGLPVVVKDNIAQRGTRTTCGSQALQNWQPTRDAAVVARLRRARAVLLAKTNLDEFAMGASTETSFFGPTRNPWDLARTPGGSSGGSAAAVAAGEAPLGLGTDTGGSIREPAALCGLVGGKPSHGSVSQYGIVPFAPTLDQAGPFGRTVADAALLHEAIVGYDLRDRQSRRLRRLALRAAAAEGARTGSVRGLTVGVVSEFAGSRNCPGVQIRFDESLALLERLGATVVELSCPSFSDALWAYYVVSSAESQPVLAPHAATGLLGAEARRRHAFGAYVCGGGDGARLRRRAERARARIREQARAAFSRVDLLVSPSMPSTAFRLGERIHDPQAMYRTDVWCVVANLAGIPALSLPIGCSPRDGLPVGLQLLAPFARDDRLYRVGAALEAAQGPLPAPPDAHLATA